MKCVAPGFGKKYPYPQAAVEALDPHVLAGLVQISNGSLSTAFNPRPRLGFSSEPPITSTRIVPPWVSLKTPLGKLPGAEPVPLRDR